MDLDTLTFDEFDTLDDDSLYDLIVITSPPIPNSDCQAFRCATDVNTYRCVYMKWINNAWLPAITVCDQKLF